MSAIDSPVSPYEIFPDPSVAALAEALAAGADSARVRELAQGVDLSSTGDKRVTLLQWALLHRNLEGMQALLDAGADPAQPGMDGDTAVHFACMLEDPRFLQALLAHGADPDTANGDTGAAPLRAALVTEREEQFRMLLAAGADPDHADRMGNTPLHVAGLINEPRRALDLLNAGADPARRNVQDVTFQRYLFLTRPDLLDADTSRAWEAVLSWLFAHDVPLDTAPA
jgi:uncharacterized protein